MFSAHGFQAMVFRKWFSRTRAGVGLADDGAPHGVARILRAPFGARFLVSSGINGRGERIRTSGPCVPNTVLYQAELLPDRTGQMASGTSEAGSIERGAQERNTLSALVHRLPEIIVRQPFGWRECAPINCVKTNGCDVFPDFLSTKCAVSRDFCRFRGAAWRAKTGVWPVPVAGRACVQCKGAGSMARAFPPGRVPGRPCFAGSRDQRARGAAAAASSGSPPSCCTSLV